ncbi:MAG TPA: DUF5994 family protein [Nocardioidaceae bacterium]
MTSPDTFLIPEAPDSRPPRRPLRLQLSGAPGHAVLDGGWWPHSREIDIELADLVDQFPEGTGCVARALYSRPDWDGQPHRIRVTRGWLKTGSFPGDNTRMVVLTMATGEQLRLLVVPPGHPTGQRAMTLASDPSNRWSAREVLAVCALDEEQGGGQDHWTDAGGSWWRHEDGPPSYRSPR